MKYTNNHHFPQWEESDRILMTDFNKMTADMETELDKVKDEAAGGRQAIQQTIRQIQANLGANGKNARIAFGSYKGAGKFGENNANHLEVGFVPVVAFVMDSGEFISTYIRGCKTACAIHRGDLIVNWTQTGFSWYAYKDESSLPGYMQNNAINRVYYYCVIGYDQ